jgi:hypothetical protein
MSFRTWIVALVLVSFFSVLADETQAWPRWRRRRSTPSYSGAVQIASKLDRESGHLRRLRVYYDYDKAKSPKYAFHDRIRVFLRLEDDAVLDLEQPVVAEVKLTDLAAPDTTHVKWVPVSLTHEADQKDQVATFDVANGEEESIVEPAKVYRLFVTLHREAETYDEQSALGRVPTPYYVATSGESVLDKARQQIAMRTFREFYYTERGWNRNAEYPMNCHEFYCWATGFCTTESYNGRTNVFRLFRGTHSYRNGWAVRTRAAEGPVHGDFVSVPGHVFMLLAYDAERGRVWTMEGNFNHTIEVCLRPIGNGWSVGHLHEELIDPAAVQPEIAADEGEVGDGQPVALDRLSPDVAAMP